MQGVTLRVPETVVKVDEEKAPVGKLRMKMGVSVKTTVSVPVEQPVQKEVAPLTQEALEKYWGEMLEAIKEEQPKLVDQLRGRELRLEDGDMFAVVVNNSYLDAEIRPHLIKMLTILREKSGRQMLNCRVEVVYEEKEAVAYAPRDKYDVMVKKNPVLEKMRELFPEVDY